MSSIAKTITSTDVEGQKVNDNDWKFEISLLGFETSDKTAAPKNALQGDTSLTSSFSIPVVLFKKEFIINESNYKNTILKWLRDIKQVQVFDDIHFEVEDIMSDF